MPVTRTAPPRRSRRARARARRRRTTPRSSSRARAPRTSSRARGETSRAAPLCPRSGRSGRRPSARSRSRRSPRSIPPDVRDGAELARALVASRDLAGKRVLVPRAEDGRDEALEILRAAGAEVVDVIAYRTRRRRRPTTRRSRAGAELAARAARPRCARCSHRRRSPRSRRSSARSRAARDAFVRDRRDHGRRAARRPGSREVAVAPRTDAGGNGAARSRRCIHRDDELSRLPAAPDAAHRGPPPHGPRDPALRPTTSSIRCSSCRARASRSRSARCPGSSTSRSTRRSTRRRPPPTSASRRVILFGIPEHKDAVGSEAWKDQGVVQKAIRAIKKARPELVVMADACFCEYTDHGHCGVLHDGELDNDASLENLARTVVSYAKAGVDVVAPSRHARRLRHRVPREPRRGGLRSGRDHGVLGEVRVGVLRPVPRGGRLDAAVGRSPRPPDGLRRTSPRRCARSSMDVAEGADIVMVKPALAYLDVIRAVSRRDQHADRRVQRQRRVRDDRGRRREAAGSTRTAIVMETLIGIRRAGADIIISYHAPYACKLLAKQR